VKEVVKLIMRVAIYPSRDELRGATEAYLLENHPEFYKSFTKARWTSYYNTNFKLRVSFFGGEFILNY
jgi:hypothetical protein